jgi:hypothetical protein
VPRKEYGNVTLKNSDYLLLSKIKELLKGKSCSSVAGQLIQEKYAELMKVKR